MVLGVLYTLCIKDGPADECFKLSNCTGLYDGCSNMNASSFITFIIYMLRQNVIHFWKELFVAFKMAQNIKEHSLYFLSYRRLCKGHSYILKFF